MKWGKDLKWVCTDMVTLYTELEHFPNTVFTLTTYVRQQTHINT